MFTLKEAKHAIESIDFETLVALRWLLIIIVVADIFGVYWFLEARKIGTAILISAIFFLMIVLLLEARKFKEMDDKERKQAEEKEKEMDFGFNPDFGMDLGDGLPSADEMNNRLETALGMNPDKKEEVKKNNKKKD